MVTTDELKINVTTLTRLMAKKTPVTILDVRPKSAGANRCAVS